MCKSKSKMQMIVKKSKKNFHKNKCFSEERFLSFDAERSFECRILIAQTIKPWQFYNQIGWQIIRHIALSVPFLDHIISFLVIQPFDNVFFASNTAQVRRLYLHSEC